MLADALCWVATHKFGVEDLVHYLDDYLSVQPAKPLAFAQNKFFTLLATLEYLNVHLADGPDKVCPPVNNSRSVGFCHVGLTRRALPFQASMQVCHQRMSSIAAGLKGEGVSKSSSSLAASKIRLQKVLPGATTFAANESVPAKDSSSLLVQFLRVNQPSSHAFRSDSLSAGSRISHFTESSSMPKKVTQVDGGHTLSSNVQVGPDPAADSLGWHGDAAT